MTLPRGLKHLGEDAFYACTSLPDEIVIPYGCTVEKGDCGKTAVYETLVTLNPNGGTLATTQLYKYYEKAYGQLPTPVKEGEVFLGWTVAGSSEIITASTKVSTWDPTLIAKWCDHSEKELRNAAEATYTSEGYTGDTYCKICGVKLSIGTVIPKLKVPERLQCGDGVYATLVDGVLTVAGSGATYDYAEDKTIGNASPIGVYDEARLPVHKIVIADGVTSVGSYLFTAVGTTTVTEIAFGSTVKYIGEGAFAKHVGLQSVTFPASLEKIGKEAFSGCSNLKSAPLNKGLRSLGENAFAGCGIPRELIIPWGCTADDEQSQTLVYETKVTLNPNGGRLDTTEIIKYYEKPYGQLPVPVREGYTFLGWVLSGNTLGTVITEDTEVSWEPVLIAKWCDHSVTEVLYASAPTYTTTGYTGDTYCKICHIKLTSGTTIPVKVLKAPKIQKIKKGQEALTVSVKNVDQEATGYVVQCCTDKNFKKNVKTKTMPRTQKSVTIKNLKAGKKYFVRVRAYKDVLGRKVYSSWSSMGNNTPQLKPEKPVIKKLSGVSGGFVLDLKKLGDKMTGFEIQYAGNDRFNGAKKMTVLRKTTHVPVYNLQVDKKYYVRVRSFVKSSNKKLYSEWSTTKSVRTKK